MKLSSFVFVCVTMLYATCMSWAQVETTAAPVIEPVIESVATPVAATTGEPAAKVVFVPSNFEIQQRDNDVKIFREKGESQRSKGTAMLVTGAVLIPVGLVMVAINFQDYVDYYTSNDIEGRESAVIAFIVGDVALTAGVILAIVGGVVRSNGNKKIERADEYERAKTAMDVKILPIADVANKRGGLMLSANF